MEKNQLLFPYSVEVAEGLESSKCQCCMEICRITHGFVYKNNDAHAIYYASWVVSHKDNCAYVALGIGDWDESTTEKDRLCFNLKIYSAAKEYQLFFIDPQEAPWKNNSLLGVKITKVEAKQHPLKEEVFQILNEIILSDQYLKDFLDHH